MHILRNSYYTASHIVPILYGLSLECTLLRRTNLFDTYLYCLLFGSRLLFGQGGPWHLRCSSPLPLETECIWDFRSPYTKLRILRHYRYALVRPLFTPPLLESNLDYPIQNIGFRSVVTVQQYSRRGCYPSGTLLRHGLDTRLRKLVLIGAFLCLAARAYPLPPSMR